MREKVNSILLDPSDNVVVCVETLENGARAVYRTGDECKSVEVTQEVPVWHKIALRDLRAGDEIVRYGEVIGKCTEDIPCGGWVSHLNIRGIPRDYASEIL